MSRCRSFLPFSFPPRPSLCLNSLIPPPPRPPILPFLYPSRSFTEYGRSTATEWRSRRIVADEDIPFAHDDGVGSAGHDRTPAAPLPPDPGDPWAFLFCSEVPQLRASGRTTTTVAASVGSSRAQRAERLDTNPTITEREREIFTKIFESILSEKSSFMPQNKQPTRSVPSQSLTALLESAVGPQSFGSEISFGPKDAIDQTSASVGLARASTSKEYPATLRAAAARAAGLKQPVMSRQDMMQEGARIEALYSLIREMEACETDLELRLWMDDKVFKAAGDSPPPTSSSSEPQQEAEKEGQSKPPPQLSASYADLLVSGMKILRENFNDLAGAISIFERTKRLGAESYVVGCSTAVYNQILEVKWESFRDMYKIVEIIQEMKVNAIEPNTKTVEILRTIAAEVKDMRDGGKGEGPRLLHAAETEGGGLLDKILDYIASVDPWQPRSERDRDGMDHLYA